jgi:hypothetical protein
MTTSRRGLNLLAAAALLLVPAGRAAADRLVIHYGAQELCSTAALKPGETGCGGPSCQCYSVFKSRCCHAPRPNQLLTFCHPCTGKPVTVPLALPLGTPRVEHVYRRIVFNYGSYTVAVRFLPDGSVEVIYYSGPLRPLW